jgi:hypothetical protein
MDQRELHGVLQLPGLRGGGAGGHEVMAMLCSAAISGHRYFVSTRQNNK